MRNLLFALLTLTTQLSYAQTSFSNYFNAMQWRCIGPHRGGRTVGATGVAQQPNVFYIGVNNGGVWKTTDYGRTWFPIFDDQPTGSVGDVVVAPSNPDIIYVGSGEGLQRPDLSVGDGVYKSSDGGKTWINTGLKEAQQIGGLAIDPTNENRVFAAALGHPYGANKERGIYRTLDGGKNWEKVLFIDENTGAIQVAIDPKNSNIVYADLWAGRLGPWENGAWNGKESGLFKSIDGGTTWKKLTNGLPTTQQGLGRIGFCIAPSDPNRLYATVDAEEYGGIYRSDNGGENWYLLSRDARYWGRGSDFAEIKVDPANADIVYTANVVTWKSIDGGKKWNAFRGAPGGDDYHRIWINPTNPAIILLVSDQGAMITVNGGETFSSWYNQPTAQFYHVSTDNSFPYNVYGGQQESGSVGIPSRGNDGQISYREWHPVGVEEYGYVAVDPLDQNIVYGGKITKYDKRNGQVQNISPEAVRSGKYRFIRTAPVLFSPIDPKTLYFAGNVLFKTRDGGNSWQVISPDLTRESWDIPESVGIYSTEEMKKMPRRGVIYTVAPSFKDINTIWAGTDDGYIQLTKDGGKTWKNVTPPSISSWSKVSLMEASHTDVTTAYAAINRIRCSDMKPHIYKTNNGGVSWKEIVNGLPDDPINVVREDPKIKGLLFAGSERCVYVSFDDGEHWESLRLNMPATSIRDLVIKDDDIVVGTHGRSFWILDDITPLRQRSNISGKEAPVLFKPQTAIRIRWSMYTDTPVPQEEPSGKNPPDGAIVNYYLAETANEVRLEIKDENEKLIREYSNKDTSYNIPDVNIPQYWIRPQQILSAQKGSHRFLWDMKYAPLNIPPSYPISAIFQNTAPNATAPWVMPGNYKVTLMVDGKKFVESLIVKIDPRVKSSAIALKQQHDLSMICYKNKLACMKLLNEMGEYKGSLNNRSGLSTGSEKERLEQLIKQISSVENGTGLNSEPTVNKMNATFTNLFNQLEEVDNPPTSQLVLAIKEAQKTMEKINKLWVELSKPK
ncbi:MAG: WD40/YVTN/BNR-like repeat-containing protein [Chitinophagaceae bacterium]